MKSVAEIVREAGGVERFLASQMSFTIRCGDALTVLRTLPDESVYTCVTSPPYWGLRDYGHAHQIGMEQTPEEYVAKLVDVFREVRRVLRSDGTLWLNLGDSYFGGNKGNSGPLRPGDKQATNVGSWSTRRRDTGTLSPTRSGGYDGLKVKDLCGIPWRLAFALQEDGWWLRCDVIWSKPNPMPESVEDRPTKSHEYVFLLSKSERYYYDGMAIREPAGRARACGKNSRENVDRDPAHLQYTSGNKQRKLADGSHTRTNSHMGSSVPWIGDDRNRRSVWTFPTLPVSEGHFATYTIELAEICVLAGCPPGELVLDPFSGTATTGLAALKQGRSYLGIELKPEYIDISYVRARKYYPLLVSEET